MSDRLPPYAQKAEEGIIGCVLTDPAFCLPILRREGIGARHFYDLRYGKLLALVAEMHAQGLPVDDVLLWPRIEAAGIRIELPYLQSLRDSVPSAANIEYYLPDLQAAFRRRQLIQLATKASQIAYDTTQDLAAVQDAIEQLNAFVRYHTDDLPEIVNAFDLCEREHAEPSELVHGLLHQGSKLVLGGGSKSFKTWTLLDLAISVSHGEPWLSLKTVKAPVLYLNLEIQEWAFRKRIMAVAAAKNLKLQPGLLEIWNLRGHTASYHELLPRIRSRLKERGIKLIILDPVYKLLGDLDENSAGDIGKLMASLEYDLAIGTGAAVAFGAHFSKGNQAGKEAIDRISGSGVFARDPDSILTFTRHATDGAFTVEATLRNFSPLSPFVVRWDYPLFRRSDDLNPADLKQVKGGRPSRYKADMLISALGKSKKGISSKDWLKRVTANTGMGRSKFFELLDELEIENRIKKLPNDSWILCSPESPQT